ncbi:MAG: Arc family DNA-binding protein [Brachymonas sp.]|nr:Arc family DNA-binding protein [Brachymonas sp.]
MGKQDEFIKTALRVPPDLHKQLHEAAAANNRTFNAEIVSRLQESFVQHASAYGKLPMVEPFSKDAAIKRLEDMIEQIHGKVMGKIKFAPDDPLPPQKDEDK